jgi:hypothetical protein
MHLTTSYKPRIGRQESFAIGARDLSQALSGIPQGESIRLDFDRSYRRDDHLVHVMTFRYWYIPEFIPTFGGLPGWRVSVRAVPRVLKHQIKTLLIEGALPNIARPWLFANADLFGRMGEKALDLVFDEAEERIRGFPGYTRRPLEPDLARLG